MKTIKDEVSQHDRTGYHTWPMFARDQWPRPSNPTINLYGAHPFYMALDKQNNANGVFFYNLHAQEVETPIVPLSLLHLHFQFVVGPTHVQYRSIGGDLRMFFLPGPTPELVMQQYHSLLGGEWL